MTWGLLLRLVCLEYNLENKVKLKIKKEQKLIHIKILLNNENMAKVSK